MSIESELSGNLGRGWSSPGRCAGCGILSPPKINRPSLFENIYEYLTYSFTSTIFNFYVMIYSIISALLPSVCFP